jgi:hypothetical protein
MLYHYLVEKPCRQDKDGTIRSRIIQIGTDLITIMRGKTLLFFSVRGQGCGITLLKRPCSPYRDQTINSRIMQLDTLGHHDERKQLLLVEVKGQVYNNSIKAL